jgi:two-component system, OmpR family, sensor histidine kinase KdpD
MIEHRPDPDALLRRLATEETPKRGRLKVFFGASPGVGKTYAMLEAARARRTEGVDVVIGWVETHGRAETAALAEGLEQLPPRDVEYRGVTLREFDLDRALARQPTLLLLDELAHTNAPGSRHDKRWQDVGEILDAGITVYTTLNVQHLESLNDLVTRVTGIAVRETVPDRILDEADEVEFVDLPPEDLLKRLADGKVYLPDRTAQAVRHFFRRGNLLALRELALRRTAEHVDADVRDYRRDHEIESTWPVAERILVCVRPNPESEKLVRAARRIAAQLKAEWIVACVESPAQPALTPSERCALARSMKLAEELGAATTVLSGDSVSEALLAFARERNVSRIVVGKPLHSRWRDRIKGSLLDEIVRGSGGIEVVVIPGGTKGPGGQAETAPAGRQRLPFLWSLGVVVACTLVCWAMFRRFDNSNLIMVYLLGVAFVATRYGRTPSALAAVLSVAAFDFFFVPPVLTFAVGDTQYLVTFGVMLVVSLLVSNLAARVRAQAESARARERRTQVLYAVSRDLAGAKTLEEVARAAERHVSELVQGPVEVLLPRADGQLASPEEAPSADAREAAVARWAFDHRRVAGLGTDTLPGATSIYIPLEGSRSALGVLGVRPHDSLLPLAPKQMELLETLARQTASGLERLQLASEAEQARLAAEAERLRSTLLGSVSHDLRTPLAAIEGASSTLLDRHARLGDDVREDLLVTIREESQRLSRRVRNLLDMTRLDAGAVTFNKEWQPLEEVIGAALTQLEERLRGRDLRTHLSDRLLQAPLDAVLIEQVLVNLLENAIKYSSGEIEVRAWRGEAEVVVEVADRGPGVPAGEDERIFERFYRATGEKAPRGVGLGLAICRAIVLGHGGRIWAENRPGGGAAFRFALPLEGEPPAPEPEEAPEETRRFHDERG